METPKFFIDTSQEVGEYGKDHLNEFYLHNYVLSCPFKWNPNPYVGDVQLWTLFSWIMKEDIRDIEMNKYHEAKKGSRLFMRVESPTPEAIATSCQLLIQDV